MTAPAISTDEIIAQYADGRSLLDSALAGLTDTDLDLSPGSDSWSIRQIVNLHGALKKMKPLLEARLSQSQFAAWHGSLHLDGGQWQATLQIANGKIEVTDDKAGENVIRGGADIARFVIGSDEPGEIIRQADMECTGIAVPLVRVLFPNLHPMMSHWDEY